MGGLRPRWPLVLRSLQLPHAYHTSMYLEVIAVLHYHNHDGVIHACISTNALAPSSVYSILPQCIRSHFLSCICVFSFLFTAMHVKCLAFCVWEWRRYSIQQFYQCTIEMNTKAYLHSWDCWGWISTGSCEKKGDLTLFHAPFSEYQQLWFTFSFSI